MQARRWVILGCKRSAGAVLDELLASGWSLPADVEWVTLPCGSAIEELHLLKAFEAGAERVLVLSCFDGACRSVDGSAWVDKRVRAAAATLSQVGIAPERLQHHHLAPNMAADLRVWIEQLVSPTAVAAAAVAAHDGGEA
jgi:coenzyme F420-reducing hydrogenase delta subunit